MDPSVLLLLHVRASHLIITYSVCSFPSSSSFSSTLKSKSVFPLCLIRDFKKKKTKKADKTNQKFKYTNQSRMNSHGKNVNVDGGGGSFFLPLCFFVNIWMGSSNNIHQEIRSCHSRKPCGDMCRTVPTRHQTVSQCLVLMSLRNLYQIDINTEKNAAMTRNMERNNPTD